jgi:monofunctional biosynthetic peptidoglycan transglycosylase
MKKGRGKRIGGFFGRIALGFVAISMFFVVLYRFVPVYLTPLMLLRCGQQLAEGKTLRLQHRWVPLAAMSGHLPLAVVCSEDQTFLRHFGFDLQAIESALASFEDGGSLRGASTISQQTAKNVFLLPHRSWLRKGFEVYFTLLIEAFWSKKRILEVYLNSIEMGQGVYGAEAAATQHFQIRAKNLSRTQAAAIAAILPNPLKYRANPPSPYIKKRIRWITGQMSRFGTLHLQ